MANSTYDRASIEREAARYQRRLIPLNIAVVIISLVAALSIMFAPIITVDLTKADELISLIEGTDGSVQPDGNEEGEQSTVSVVLSAMKDFGASVSVSTLGMLQFAMAENVSDYVTETASQTLREESDAIITDMAIPTAIEYVRQNSDKEIPDIEQPEVILDKFKGLESAQPEEVDGVINSVADEVQRQLGEELITPEIKDNIVTAVRDVYDNTVSQTEDGTFSIEACICILISQYINDDGSLEDIFDELMPSTGTDVNERANFAADFAADDATGTEEGTDGGKKVYTTYDELISGMLENAAGTSDNAETEEAIRTAQLVMLLTGCSMLFSAAMWLILAIFALVHTFTKNRRFTMWYVKLWGFTPCLVFGVAPLLAAKIVPAFVEAETAAIVTTACGMLSTLAWISGACYILLWLISIFWAFPTKRKIRRCEAQLRYASH